MQKKAEIGLLPLILGIGITVLLVVFLGVLTGQVFQSAESDLEAIADNDVVEETFTADNDTWVYLAHGLIQEDSIDMRNGTKPIVEADDFDYDLDGGALIAVNDSFDGFTITINYTYGVKEVRDSVFGGVSHGFSAWENTTKYLPLIILGLVIGLIMSVILGLAMFRQGNNGAL